MDVPKALDASQQRFPETPTRPGALCHSSSVVGRSLAVLALLALAPGVSAGCTNPAVRPPPAEGIEVRGRVVDAESCASTAGCLGVEGMIVTLRGWPDSIVSAPTGPDGAFALEGVPGGGYRHLIARSAESAALYAPTLNPMVVHPDDVEGIYGVELYVLGRDPDSLLEALRTEGIDLLLGGGYVGQAVHVTGSRIEAAEGVRVHMHPEPASLRFVAALPRYVPGEPVLKPATAETTGPFGIFVAEADGPTELAVVAPIEDGVTFDLVISPIEPGLVTYAVHRGR